MGLPFDAVDMDKAESVVRNAISTRSRCFLSTPNLNFSIACRVDEAFRQSVLISDLVVADGMPIVWMARLLKIPIHHRVAGSSLFEALSRGPHSSPIKVFFFGFNHNYIVRRL